ncbi:hypothetical protein EZV62_024670 [Acer yangbiense]|uniref:TF-B3 domain-containing protein n=1 Tax=Acer yangbiense TaxID=1000413 RepID=A0A5C7GWC7_9ROSI|nr:hypothetical protein EZV62_024670 [Acer yangbiense]
MSLSKFQISKILTESDIISKIGLPIEIVEHMNPIMNNRHYLDLKVVDARNQEWILLYYTRPNGDREGPVFTTGWRRFVRDKRLQVGDKFIFYENQVRGDDDGELKMQMEYMVEVKRPGLVTFQGQPIITLDAEYFDLV